MLLRGCGCAAGDCAEGYILRYLECHEVLMVEHWVTDRGGMVDGVAYKLFVNGN